jgi:hypothetical protein
VKESDEPKPDAANVLAWDLSLLATSRSNNTITWTAKSKPSRTDKTLLNEEQQLRDSLLAFFVNLVGGGATGHIEPYRFGSPIYMHWCVYRWATPARTCGRSAAAS